jgi:hypothetical protein
MDSHSRIVACAPIHGVDTQPGKANGQASGNIVLTYVAGNITLERELLIESGGCISPSTKCRRWRTTQLTKTLAVITPDVDIIYTTTIMRSL